MQGLKIICFVLTLFFSKVNAQEITNPPCNFGDRTYVKLEFPPTFGKGNADLEAYFNQAFSAIKKSKSTVSLTLIIDTSGKATVSSVYFHSNPFTDETTFRNIVDSMGIWNPGRQGNCKVKAAAGLTIGFEKKAVHVLYK